MIILNGYIYMSYLPKKYYLNKKRRFTICVSSFFYLYKNGNLHYIRKMSCKTVEFVKENGKILVNRYIYYKKVTILL